MTNTPFMFAMFLTYCLMTIILSAGYLALLGGVAWLIIIPSSLMFGAGVIVCYLILVQNEVQK